MKKKIVAIAALLTLTISSFTMLSADVLATTKVKRDAGGYIIGQKPAKKVTKIKGIIVANKTYPLPKTYNPGVNKTANAALTKWKKAAKKAGYNIVDFSSFRSYSYQATLYNRYKNRDGQKKADTYSARPGYSEHQTGLAFDLGNHAYPGQYASTSFHNTPTAKWLAKNAYKYGFILRYPKGKEKITGYMYESWHFRYVGTKAAKEIYKRNITLEEYLGIAK